ncbi:MAG: D-lyxose/D-mannose family sugar isomerase [Lentisphaerae bacterium GWF2_44_16]|nr:MAG: D-lyxose/D-mannose family sugar isomerase [Lentisphaerae bacterium GWF2_44_16]
MKRSEINRYLREAVSFFSEFKFALPPWAFWSPDDWKEKGTEYNEIKECGLGWDITDFGSGDFEKTGLFLFTVRNGKCGSSEFVKPYAEKIMIVRENQVTPIHFHWKKMEDIINRGGGKLEITLWKASEKEDLSQENFTVRIDGVEQKCKAAEKLILAPGESIALNPYVYHTFRALEKMTLVGEVSAVNDDSNDNRFYKPAGRFPKIEEDEKPLYLLCNEYP